MQAALQSRFDLLQLGSHLLGNRSALDGERALSRLATDVGEAEKVEGLGFPTAAAPPVVVRKAAEFDEARLGFV